MRTACFDDEAIAKLGIFQITPKHFANFFADSSHFSLNSGSLSLNNPF